MYKCAIIAVSGGRARGHAEAYQHIQRGQLAAISTRSQTNLDAFGDQFGIAKAARYTDYREMFAREKPDLVHVNTPPDVRLEVMQAAEEAGIPALIIEKPLAIQDEDYRTLRAFARWQPQVKIAINHQLHYHPRRQALQQLVADGGIGEVRFIEASAGMNLAYQGTHSLQAIGAFARGGVPTSVFGQVAGANGLAENIKQHYAPDQCLASINYDNGINAVLRCGENAPRVSSDRPVHHHKRIAVYGTQGQVLWTMWGWETLVDGRRDTGTHEYAGEDILGQAAMTEAMFDWLEDDNAVHALNLESALSDFSVVLGIYQSALHHQVVDLPVQPEENLIAKLRDALGG